ncbi:hypothetical protein ABE85_14570 [Mitsuaria sp. 7]|nr:hypothetical protein ABE85_14570 [Mitsuaria sp. 7]
MAGWSSLANRAFLYTPGIGQTLINPAPYAISSIAYGLNNAGEVVGYSNFAGSGGSQPFKFSVEGGLQALPMPSGATPYLRASAINDVGSVAGDQWYYTSALGAQMNPRGLNVLDVNNSNLFAGLSYDYATGHSTAALWSPTGGLQTFGSIGGNNSQFMALNGAGMAVGYGENRWFTEHALIYDGQTLVDIGAQFGDRTFSQAYGISDSGLVVGRFTPGGQYGSGPMHAFAYSKEYGSFDLNNALAVGQGEGWLLLSAQDATSDGRIVGFGVLNGTMSAFMLNPVTAAVPEPSTALQASLGLMLLASWFVRKRGARRSNLLT